MENTDLSPYTAPGIIKTKAVDPIAEEIYEMVLENKILDRKSLRPRGLRISKLSKPKEDYFIFLENVDEYRVGEKYRMSLKSNYQLPDPKKFHSIINNPEAFKDLTKWKYDFNMEIEAITQSPDGISIYFKIGW